MRISRRGRWLPVLALLIGGVLALVMPGPAPASAAPVIYVLNGRDQFASRTDGTTVIWNDGSGPYDIYGFRLEDRQVFSIATGPMYREWPDIDGGVVVWSQRSLTSGSLRRSVVGRDLNTGQDFVVAATGNDDTLPAIKGNLVVWMSWDGARWSLKSRHLQPLDAPVTIAQLPIGAEPGAPMISGDRVLWGQFTVREGPATVYTPEQLHLLMAPVSGGAATLVAEDVDFAGYSFAGDVVAFVKGGALLLENVVTHQSRTIAPAALLPTTDGRYLFWIAPDVPGLSGFDLTTDSGFRVPAVPALWVAPHVSGGALTWLRADTPGQAVADAVRVADVLPSAPRPDPGETDPNWTYYGATGHYLSYGFRTFWEQSGGLPVFGYPLTEEFLQHGLTTQYTERQRFEFHPELKLTPYETELGRLGAEDAQARGLLTTGAFQPLAPGTQPTPGCLLFSETSHQVCGAFLAYWHAHGLELGDPGLSFRESVALFGYPLSEKYVDPATGLETQYFERAVFEWHPGSPEPYKVELRLLGAEQLRAFGWR